MALSMRALVVALTLWPALAGASGAYNPFESTPERLGREARAARRAGELALAASLLAEAEVAAGDKQAAPLVYERGLLMRDRGEREASVEVLRRAAEMDPRSDARVDLAAVLADLGRWPESVVVLRVAFSERGATLRADTVLTDMRFAKLVGFAPYQALIQQVREEQTGWLGKLQLRLESIETSIRAFQSALDDLTAFITRLTGLLTSTAASVVIVILLSFLVASGLGHMRVLPRPWTVLVGVVAAGAIWRGATRLLSEGKSDGWEIIGPAAGIVVGPVALAASVRWLRAWLERRRAAKPSEVEVVPADEPERRVG
jgi:hypothetical protein